MDSTFQNILVVDDSRAMRENLLLMLKPAGFSVRTATDGGKALHSVRQECPYFVIADWLMSPMNGIEFCHRLRQENLPHYVYVILLTANSRADDIITGLDAGANDFMVANPVNKMELLARLQVGSRVLELETGLTQLARCDPLTGVLTYHTFHQCFGMEWSRAIRHDHPLSCVMIDVDGLKRINDIYGRSVGDSGLRFLTETIKHRCRSSDYVCRWGGGAFCVLLPETDEHGACTWAERCCSALADMEFRSGLYTLPITASFGTAQRHEDMQGPRELLDLAQQALAVAKGAGRQRTVTAWGGCLGQPSNVTCVSEPITTIRT